MECKYLKMNNKQHALLDQYQPSHQEPSTRLHIPLHDYRNKGRIERNDQMRSWPAVQDCISKAISQYDHLVRERTGKSWTFREGIYKYIRDPTSIAKLYQHIVGTNHDKLYQLYESIILHSQ